MSAKSHQYFKSSRVLSLSGERVKNRENPDKIGRVDMRYDDDNVT